MGRIITLGRVVEDFESQGKTGVDDTGTEYVVEAGEREFRGIAGSTKTILEAARGYSAALELTMLAELVKGKNDAQVISDLQKFRIDFPRELINPDPTASTSWAWWVVDGGKKFHHEKELPGPTEHFLNGLDSVQVEQGDLLVLCAEYVTQNFRKFEPFVSQSRENGAKICVSPNVRAKSDEDKPAFLTHFKDQIGFADVVIMADSDLGHLFNPKASFDDNFKRFQSECSGYKGFVVFTRGKDPACIVDMASKSSIYGPQPDEAKVINPVGGGDHFAGTLLAQWAEEGLPLTLGNLARWVLAANAAAHKHVTNPSMGASAVAAPVIKAQQLNS